MTIGIVFLLMISLDEDPIFKPVMINRIRLSSDKKVCTIFFYAEEGRAVFEKLLPHLIEYKPKLGAVLAKALRSEYAPDVLFAYDTRLEKRLQNKIT